MIKYFYKTFFITCLSWSLLVVQSNALYAQVSTSSSDPNGMTTTDSNGLITHTQAHSFNKIKDADMLTSITMLAGGFVTGRMLAAYRPMTMDVMVAGAAGAAFVAGEVMSNIKFKGTMDAMTLEVQKKSDGTVNEEQVQRLRDLKKSYEEAKGATKTKKTLQLAAAVGFGAAAAMATYMAFTETSMVASCTAAFKVAQGQMSTCVAAGTAAGATGVAAEAARSCGMCATRLTAYETQFMSYTAQRETPALSAKKDITLTPTEKSLGNPSNTCWDMGNPAVKGVTATLSPCKLALGQLIANQTDAEMKAITDAMNMSYNKILPFSKSYVVQNQYRVKGPNIFEKTLDLFFPSAQAGWLPLLGLGASTAAAFFLISGTTAAEIDLIMFAPKGRAIGFTLFAGLAFMASKSSENVIKELEANIAKIDSILAELDKLALGAKAQNIVKSNIAIKTVNPATKNVGTIATPKTANTPCLTSSASTNCAAVENQLASMQGFSALPESFKTVASQVMGVGSGVSGTKGISGSTLAAADALGNKANAIKNLLKNRQSALEKLSGNKYNADKEKDKLRASLAAKITKSLGKSGTTATGMMASMGMTPINTAGMSKDPLAEDLKKDPAVANIADISAPGAKDDSMKLDFSDSASGTVASAVSGSGNPEYDITEGEISGENGPSIFEVISSRYIKSGYPKLLEEVPSKN